MLQELLLNKGMLLVVGGGAFFVLGLIAVFSSGSDSKQVEIKEKDTHPKKKKKNDNDPASTHLDLKDASGLWQDDEDPESIIQKIYQKNKNGERIDLGDLTPIWRDEKQIQLHDGPEPEFQHERIKAFFKKHIQGNAVFRSSPLQTRICTSILELLDRDGNCPSVVNVKNDYEAANLLKNKVSYDLLEGVSLLGHSLNVAEETISKLSDQRLIIPTALIAALGHDLGKMESARNELYRTGNHPLVSISVLHTIPGFEELPRLEEVSKAIANHHSKSETHIGKILQAADQAARKKELSALNAKQMKARQEELRESLKTNSDDKKEQEKPKVEEKPKATEPSKKPTEQAAPKSAPKVEQKTEGPKPQEEDTGMDLLPGEEEDTGMDLLPGEEEDTGMDLLPGEEEQDEINANEKSNEESELDGIEPPSEESDEQTIVPLMITDSDIASLKKLGYSDDEIRDFTPSEAFEIIEQEIKRCDRDDSGALTSIGSVYTEEETAEEPEAAKPSSDEIDVSWIDLGELLKRVAKEVNVLDGPRWKAFSMLNGVVYAQVGLIMDIIRDLAKENNDLSFEAIDDEDMKRNVLVSVIDRLREELNAIDTDLLVPGYIGCHFHLKWENGQESKKPSFYVPLKAESVGDLSEMENSKPKRIRKVVEVLPIKNKEA